MRGVDENECQRSLNLTSRKGPAPQAQGIYIPIGSAKKYIAPKWRDLFMFPLIISSLCLRFFGQPDFQPMIFAPSFLIWLGYQIIRSMWMPTILH